MNEHIDPGQLVPHVRTVPAQIHPLCDAERVGKAWKPVREFVLSEQRPANDGGPLIASGEGVGERAQEQILSLPRSQPADDAEVQWAAGGAVADGDIGQDLGQHRVDHPVARRRKGLHRRLRVCDDSGREVAAHSSHELDRLAG